MLYWFVVVSFMVVMEKFVLLLMFIMYFLGVVILVLIVEGRLKFIVLRLLEEIYEWGLVYW